MRITKSILLAILFAVFGSNKIASAQTTFNDDFTGNTINPAWQIVNPNPPSSVSLTGNGELKILATAANGGSDYWPSINFNAPRMFVPVSGDWTLQVKMRYNPMRDFEGAGILVLPDATSNGTNGVRIFERFYNGSFGQAVLNCGGYYSCPDTILYIKISKVDTAFIGTYSQDSITWSIPDTTYITDPINFVGVHTIRKTYNSNMDDAVSYYDYFYLTDNSNVSVGTIDRTFDFNMYPNPASDILNVNIPDDIIIDQMELLDQYGKMVMCSTGKEKTLNIAHVSQGIYYLKIIAGESVLTKKIIVSR